MDSWPEESPDDPGEIDPLVRELETELGRPARFAEPSAAERARKPTRKHGWGGARKARKLRKPVPEPGSGQRAARGRRRAAGPGRARSRAAGRGRGRPLLTAAVVIACVAGAVFGISKLKLPGPSGPAPVTNGAIPPSTRSPYSLPAPTPAHPFAGTPAASWVDGAEGIVMPDAHRVSSYSAAQVAAAYQTAKKMLIAANLDSLTLRGGSPNAFAGMLIPEQRTEFIQDLDKIGLTSHGFQKSSRTWVASFAPGTTQLVGKVIKVHGAMHAATGTNGTWHNVLQIHADYRFAYAVEQPGQPSMLMRIVVHDIVDIGFAAYTGGPLEPWWIQEGGGVAGARCDVNDGFIHPQFPNGPPDKVTPTGTRINPYTQNVPAETGRCQATTGT